MPKYDYLNEPIVKSKGLMDLIWSHPEKKARSELNSLYDFYLYTAKWQKTNQVKATTGYVANHFGWHKDKVKKRKKELTEMGLIENVAVRDHENKISGHYILVKFLWGKEAIDKLQELRPELFTSGFHPPSFPAAGFSGRQGNRPQMLKGTVENALSTNSEKMENTNVLFHQGASRRETKNPKRKLIPVKSNPESNQPKTVEEYTNKPEYNNTMPTIPESNPAPPSKPETLVPGPRPPRSVREKLASGERINGTARPKKVEGRIKAPRPIRDIMDHWSELGLRQIRSDKTHNSIVRTLKDLIKGNYLFNGQDPTKPHSYSVQEIKKSITNFALAALNPDYEPSNGYKSKLKGTSLSEFIYNEYSPKTKSLFYHYLKNEPQIVAESLPLPTPINSMLSNGIARIFKELSGRQDLTYVENKCLIEFSNRFQPYFVKNFSQYVHDRYGIFYEALTQAWLQAYPDEVELRSKCNIRFFTGKWVIENLMPRYVSEYMTGEYEDLDSECMYDTSHEQETNLRQAQEEALGDYADY